MPRLIPIEFIPDSLWDKHNSTLILPTQLVNTWLSILDKYDLRIKAMQESDKDIDLIGGMRKEETDEFLAWRFPNSSAKAMLTILDPKNDLPKIPDVFARIFSGNQVFIADLPCGSGTTSLAILSVFCELRKKNIIPRMPLDVIIVGGEISEYARTYAKESLEILKNDLESQAINVRFKILDWDVCDKFSNSNLTKCIDIDSHEFPAKLLYMSHFSGFLHKDTKWKKAQDQFDELFRHFMGDGSIVLWTEPGMKRVTNEYGLFSKITKWFSSNFFKKIGVTQDTDQYTVCCSSLSVKHPIRPDHSFVVNLAVRRFDLYPKVSEKDET